MKDHDLQLALARMLPRQITYDETFKRFHRIYNGRVEWPEVKPTEWFHVCWLVEQTLTLDQRVLFINTLRSLLPQPASDVDCVMASWQLHAQALIKVKGGSK